MLSEMRTVLRAWASDAPKSQLERLVLVFVASHGDRNGRLRIDPREVASSLHCSARSLESSLAALANSGVIDAVRWNDTGAWTVKVRL